jgi:hypothetical protein
MEKIDEFKEEKVLDVAAKLNNPINIDEEETKFFKSECTYNPIFQYKTELISQETLNTHYLLIAIKILNEFISIHHDEENYLQKEGGRVITKEETEKAFIAYFKELDILDQVELCFEENKVSPTTISHDPVRQISKVTVGLPIEYRERRIQSVLAHEIGTHFLRHINDTLQTWHKKRKKYKLRPFLETEEGLAVVNQEIVRNGCRPRLLYKAALNYYSTCKAATMSFTDLYKDLAKYVGNPHRRWKCCVRVKRGLTDTSLPGGNYKDQAYLVGALKILKNRKLISFPRLYSGKISVEDSLSNKKVIRKVNIEDITMPTFMQHPNYMAIMDEIAKDNFVD